MKGCRPVNKEEFIRIVNSFHGNFAVRNKALFVFGCFTGYRISEILSIHRGDVIGQDGKIVESVTVQKKYMKGKLNSRTVFLNDTVKKYLSPWLKEQERKGYLRIECPLFCSSGGRKMDRVTAWRILKNAFCLAGVYGKVATHTMRKTFANGIYFFYEGKKDALRIVSKALGHKSIDSTDRYLTFIEEDITRAISGMEEMDR